jgi:hypothetical protein
VIVGPNDVWMCGGSDQVGSTMDPSFIYHYDGSDWSIHGGPNRYSVPSIWPAGDGRLWVAAPESYLAPAADGGTTGPVALDLFDGQTMRPVEPIGLAERTWLYSLWGAGPDDIWAAGDALVHWDGRAWRVVDDAPATIHDDGKAMVTGEPSATWVITPGPRFFRLSR